MNYNSATMVTVKEVKEALRKHFVSSKIGATRYQVRDISGGNSQGYQFSIVNTEFKTEYYKDSEGNVITSYTDWMPIEIVLESFLVYDSDATNMIGQKGAFRVVFDRKHVESILGYRV
jgi:hypothetical protein